MADSKSSKPKSKTSAPARPAPTPPRTTTTTTKRVGDPNAPKLVKKEAPPPPAPRKEIDPNAEPQYHPWLDPDRMGRMLHHRPAWVDELIAIVLVVFGLVSMLALINTAPDASLSALWSDLLRQALGQIGAVMMCLMIMAVGLLIVLPRIGIHLPLPLTRITAIEIAYVAFLAVLHLLVHDPEQRAVARSGQAGGYAGYIVSLPLSKLFGSGVATFFFGGVILVALSYSTGIRRRHLRQALTYANKQLELFAERMKREPQAVPVAEPPEAVNAASTPAVAPTPARQIDPMARPLRPADLIPDPPKKRTTTTTAPVVPAALATTPDAELTAPAPQPPPKPAPKPPSKPSAAPVAPEKRTRYFTVEDFKEVRQVVKREGEEDLPPLTLLNDIELNKPTEQEINNNVRIIEHTLLEFDIDVDVVDVKVGPTVTQYAVQPFREVTTAEGEVVMQRVRVNKIASLTNDLALALSAKRLRIQPYVPGQSYMAIEVPNRTPSTVALRPVMESETFARAFVKRDPDVPGKTYEVPLVVPLGRDVSGSAFVVDLATMPHLLIAGT